MNSFSNAHMRVGKTVWTNVYLQWPVYHTGFTLNLYRHSGCWDIWPEKLGFWPSLSPLWAEERRRDTSSGLSHQSSGRWMVRHTSLMLWFHRLAVPSKDLSHVTDPRTQQHDTSKPIWSKWKWNTLVIDIWGGLTPTAEDHLKSDLFLLIRMTQICIGSFGF